MSNAAPAKSLNELVEGGTTVMCCTVSPDGTMSSRPITVAGIEGSVLSFLIDTTADWVAHARAATTLHATVSDTRGNTYLSLNGRPSFTTDPAVIDELWNPFAGSFFDEGRDDPNIAVLRLDVTDGSYWDGPSGRLGELISLVRAKFGDGDDAGERGRIDA